MAKNRRLGRYVLLALCCIALIYATFGPGRRWLAYYFRLKAYEYEQVDDWARGAQMARLSLALVPNDVYTLTMLGNALEMLQRYDEQERVFRKAVTLAPDYVYAAAGLGSALYYLGRDEEAEHYYIKAVGMDPSIAQIQTDYAGTLIALNRNDEAETHLREALRIDPRLPMAHGSLGLILARRGKTKEAEAELREEVRLAPQWWKSHLFLSTFLLQQNRLDEAQAEIQQGLRLEPNAADLIQDLGELYWRQGKLAEAEQQYRKGFQEAKVYARAAHELAVFLCVGKGQRQFNKGEFTELERTLRETIRLWPTYAEPYNNLGYSLISNSNRWQEAESLIRKSIELASAQVRPSFAELTSAQERPDFLDSLGELLARQPQRRAEAVAAYREAFAGYSAAGNSNDANRVREILSKLEAP